jgi:hypothetical protein
MDLISELHELAANIPDVVELKAETGLDQAKRNALISAGLLGTAGAAALYGLHERGRAIPLTVVERRRIASTEASGLLPSGPNFEKLRKSLQRTSTHGRGVFRNIVTGIYGRRVY